MSPDQALALISQLFQATIILVGPILAASLIAGVLVGIVQTATQVNEASVSYVVKVLAVVGVLLTLGPTLADQIMTYARHSIERIETVVR